MKNINQHIKDCTFKPVYLLYGEEDYLKKTYRNRLKSAIISSDDTMNCNYFSGSGINFKEVIDIAETMPFFADNRLLIIEDSGTFKNPKEEILNYIDTISPTTILLFVENEVDKRSRMFKRVKEIGYACELGRQTEDTLAKWVLGSIASEKKKITNTTMKMFLSKTGLQMENISKELEKLICYTIDKDVITSEDVEAVCTTEITGKIFEMIDAMSTKNSKKLFSLYQDLLAVKEPPIRILYMISRQFNIMLQVKELLQKGFGKEVIVEKTKLHSFVISKTMNQVKNFSIESIKMALNDLLDMEEMIKTGRLEDKIGIEMFFVKYCS